MSSVRHQKRPALFPWAGQLVLAIGMKSCSIEGQDKSAETGLPRLPLVAESQVQKVSNTKAGMQCLEASLLCFRFLHVEARQGFSLAHASARGSLLLASTLSRDLL